MRVVCDIEANGKKPTQIWVIVCKDIDSGTVHIFRKVTQDAQEKQRFLQFASKVSLWVGHNFLGYDLVVLRRLLELDIDVSLVVDTLIVSKLADYSGPISHSIEAYGEVFGIKKVGANITDWSQYTQEMEDRCVSDTEICLRIYNKYLPYIYSNGNISNSLLCESRFQLICNSLSDRGFHFDLKGATTLLERVNKELAELDKKILSVFPPREILIREFTPKATKFGTISKSSVPRALHSKIHEFEIGKTYPFTKLEPFNPGSPKQVVAVLNEAGWKPVEKTKTHIETERELRHLRYQKNRSKELDLKIELLDNKLCSLKISGWKVSEANLATLPENAPSPAKTLARRILLESRRRTLTEWISCVEEDGRIHGTFYGIGAWTHRMAHQNPNTANIPTGRKLFAKEMRALWQAPKGRLLVGVDADSIQFRIAAHYINDPALIKKIVEGKKSDGTDPHSYNRHVIGDFCKSRDASKRTLFSLILGGGIPKLAEILECSHAQAEAGRDNLYHEYPGLVRLKREIVVEDARNGFFVGLDGRRVPIPGDSFSERKHLCSSGYLQCGEAVIMKHACIRWHDKLNNDKELLDISWFLVNLVHDEYQTEGPNNVKLMLKIAKAQADAIKEVGEELGCRCPLAGSYTNDHDFTVGTNWYQTH